MSILAFIRHSFGMIRRLLVLSFGCLGFGTNVVCLCGVEYREMQGENRSLGWLARYAYRAPHGFHHPLYQIKPQAHSPNLAVSHALGAIEGVKNMRKVCGRNSNALVLHGDLHLRRSSVRRAERPQEYPAILARVFHRIAD